MAASSVSAPQALGKETMPGCAGTAVAGLLTGLLRPGRVAVCGRYAAYLSPPGRTEVILAICASDAVRVPFGIRLGMPAAHAPLAGLRAGAPVTLGDGVVSAGTLRVRVSRWWSARPAVGPITDHDLASWAAALQQTRENGGRAPGLNDNDPGLLRFAGALADGDARRALAAARGLLGRGPGSTPSGDDVMGSALAVLHVLAPSHPATAALWASCGAPVAAAVAACAGGRTTPVSAALLVHASRGEVAGELADVLRCARGAGHDTGPARAAAQRLLRIGHSSGADCLRGITAAAAALYAAGLPGLRAERPGSE